MRKDGIFRILKAVKGRAEREYKVQIKGIFGSYVQGRLKRNSDIDILVDFAREADLIDWVGLSLFLEAKLKRKVDIVPEDSLRKEIKERVLEETFPL